jgi:hypothetical protein
MGCASQCHVAPQGIWTSTFTVLERLDNRGESRERQSTFVQR